MATIYGNIHGVSIMRESVGGGTANGLALVTFSLGAYTASTDSGKLGTSGTKINGVSTTDTLAQIIASFRRDGKTVTLQNATNGVAVTLEPGKHGSTEFWCGTFAVSSGSLTFNVTDSSGSEIDAASGVTDKPITLAVAYVLS